MNFDAARVGRYASTQRTVRSAADRLRADADELGSAWDEMRRLREELETRRQQEVPDVVLYESLLARVAGRAEVARERRDHSQSAAREAVARARSAERELRLAGLDVERVHEVTVLGLDAAPSNPRTEAALAAWRARPKPLEVHPLTH